MFFWHLGVTCVIVFFTLGARRIDYRVVLLGAILPDLVDKPLGRIFFRDQFDNSRLYGHTLLFVVVLLLGIQLILRGKTARRWFVLPIASLIHLVLDGMWNYPVILFWPLFGTRFPTDPIESYWLEAITRPVHHPWILIQEAVGLAALVWMYFAFGLKDPQRRKEFLHEGKLFAGPETTGAS